MQRSDIALLSSHVLLGLCLGFALYVGDAWQQQETQIQQAVQHLRLATQTQAKAEQAWARDTALAAQIPQWAAQGALGHAPLLRWDELLLALQETTPSTPALTWQFLPPSDFVENFLDQIQNQPINNEEHAVVKIDQIAEQEKQAALQFVTLHLHGAANTLPEVLTWLANSKALPSALHRLEWQQGEGKANTFAMELRLVHLPSRPQGKQP